MALLRTAADGRFRVVAGDCDEPPRISARAEGRAPGLFDPSEDGIGFSVDRSREFTGRIVLPLTPGLHGRVRDWDGRPVPGLFVEPEWLQELPDAARVVTHRATTDRQGRFTLLEMPVDAPFFLVARDSELIRGRSAPRTLPRDAPPSMACDIELSWTTTIHGRLIGAEGEEATIWLESQEDRIARYQKRVTCDVSGRFEFDHVAEGRFTLSSGCADESMVAHVDLLVVRGAASPELEVRLEPDLAALTTHSIRGRVLGLEALLVDDDDDGRPDVAIDLGLHGTDERDWERLELDGSFEFERIRSAACRIALDDGPPGLWIEPIDVTAGTQEVILYARPATARIRGRLVGPIDLALGAVDMTLVERDEWAHCFDVELAPDGRFECGELPPGRFDLCVDDDAGITRWIECAIDLRDGEQLDLGPVALPAVDTLRGRVTRWNGAPAGGADVELLALPPRFDPQLRDEAALEEIASGSCEPDGTFEIDSRGGSVAIRVIPAKGPQLLAWISASEAGRDLELELPRSAKLHGRAIDVAGAPLEGMRVRVRARDPGDGPDEGDWCREVATATTDRDGRFEIDEVPWIRCVVELILPARGRIAPPLQLDVTREVVDLPDFVVR